MMKLTSSTHDDFVRGFDVEALPKSFQDAINFTRRLRAAFGVQYLWIDALCIFQDSLDDWRNEGSLMSDIYANAWCNLAAATGKDGTVGLFSDRRRSGAPSILVYDDSAKATTVYVLFLASVWDPVAKSHLVDRAWVHQERTLSRRILHFTTGEIFWECQNLRASETYHSAEFYRLLHHSDLERTLLAPKLETPWSDGILQKTWSSCVANFTKGKLTKPEDKLLAIGGLAARLHQKSGGTEYFAGLWGYELEKQLIWRRSGLKTQSQRHPYRAPSWSWASVDGEILLAWDVYRASDPETGPGLKIDARKAKFVAQIVEVNTTLVGTDPFGQITGGVLRLRGSIWTGARIFYWADKHNTKIYQGKPIGDLKGSLVDPTTFLLRAKFSESEFSIHTVIYLDAPTSLELPCYYFPLFRHEQGYTADIGLVLQHTGEARGRFQRIGLFETSTRSVTYKAGGGRKGFLAAQPNNITEWDYEQLFGANDYVISII